MPFFPSGHLALEKRILPVAVVVFLLLSAWHYLPDLLFSPPFGMHFIRQTDSLAFVEYFKLGKGNLFQPGTLDLNTAPDNGRTAGEFPLIYWLASVIDQISGNTTYSIRLLHLLFVVAGHAAFVQGVTRLTNQPILALGIGCCIWGSSVVTYYSCNFLPDAAAFGLSLLGWGLFISTFASGSPRLNLPIFLALILAGLIKATASMHLLAVGGVCIFLSMKQQSATNEALLRITVLLFLGIAAISAWHLWAIRYNSQHQANYFLTSAAPMWSMSNERIEITSDLILRHWWTDYLHPSMWHALGVTLALIVIRLRRLTTGIVASIGLLALGGIGYLLLFFEKFADHDYYALHLMPLVGLVLVGGSQAIDTFHRIWTRLGIVAAIWILAIAGNSLAHHDLQRRKQSNPDSYSRTGRLLIEYDVSRMHLPEDAKVIVLGDQTPNGALSRIGRQGWSFPGYPLPRLPDYDELLRQGATHVLMLQPEKPTNLSMTLLESTDDYSLWKLTR